MFILFAFFKNLIYNYNGDGMKKIIIATSVIILLSVLIIGVFNFSYCFSEYGKKVEINFETNGGNGLPKMNYIYNYGNILTKLPIPEKKGYSFKGWYLDTNYQEKLLEMPMPQFKEDKVTLYARWELKQNNSKNVALFIVITLFVFMLYLIFNISKIYKTGINTK